MARGLPSIRRVNARNFIQEEANDRLRETIAPYQKQGLNALGVDSYDILLYIKKPSTQSCTCREVQMISALGDALAAPVKPGISETHEISIDWRRPLFGEPNEARVENDEDGTDGSEYDFDDSEPARVNHTLESSADCGICYRTGFVPGFVQYGKQRIVLTTHDVVENQGCTIDRNAQPHTFDRLTRAGYVAFDVVIPKYFNSVRYSVRNNTDVVDAEVLTADGQPCTTAWLKAVAGAQTRIRVSAETFTHLVLTFDLGTDSVKANIAQLSKQTDWTLFSTIGNLNVILPMTIPELTTGSIIVVPKVGLAMIITDITYLRPQDGRNLDWSVNTRVCQPQEPALRIHKDFPFA
jgi:hypothetical protein